MSLHSKNDSCIKMGATWYLDISVFHQHFKLHSSSYSHTVYCISAKPYVPSVPLQSNEIGFDDDYIPVQLKSLRKDFPSWSLSRNLINFPLAWLAQCNRSYCSQWNFRDICIYISLDAFDTLWVWERKHSVQNTSDYVFELLISQLLLPIVVFVEQSTWIC